LIPIPASLRPAGTPLPGARVLTMQLGKLGGSIVELQICFEAGPCAHEKGRSGSLRVALFQCAVAASGQSAIAIRLLSLACFEGRNSRTSGIAANVTHIIK
jgi:hypothetical protein